MLGTPAVSAQIPPEKRPTAAHAALVAYARGRSVAVYGSESATVAQQTLASPTGEGAVLSFLVRSVHRRRALVYLPTRPNGATGWILRSQVQIYSDPYRVAINLRQHKLVVWRRGSVVIRAAVGVGRVVSPTPSGTYYIVSRIQPTHVGTVYGAFAFGLSAHSNVYSSFGFGGDGRIGLHGTNDPSGLGHDVSHGCIRMSNRVVLKLSHLLALGTPVSIERA